MHVHVCKEGVTCVRMTKGGVMCLHGTMPSCSGYLGSKGI